MAAVVAAPLSQRIITNQVSAGLLWLHTYVSKLERTIHFVFNLARDPIVS